MQRTPSSADISTYDGCGEASKKLQMIANFIFLTASLVLIGVGKKHRFYITVFLNICNVNYGFYGMILLNYMLLKFFIFQGLDYSDFTESTC